MTSLVFAIEQIAPGLYLISVAGILYMAFELQRARHKLTVSQFKLEREMAQADQSRAITFGGLLIELLIGVGAIANLMAPTLRDIQTGDITGSPVITRFETSTPANNPPISLNAGGSGAEDLAIFSTPPPTNTPVGTILPDAPEIVGCPRDSAWIHIPGNGQLIFEATNVIGTASVSDFAFYKFEIKPAVPGAQFAPLREGDYTQQIVGGPLGQILPWEIPNGEYRFRLAVFDNTRTLRAVCEITIHISDPPPTPTPIGGGPSTVVPQ
ncbi:MAG: hypothetical protein JXQ72_17600 [Anaerolineae bacterium]|nr:hypothetical protein [Anaerolineae bacterium]